MSTISKTNSQASTGLLGAVFAVWLTVAILAGALLFAQFAPSHADIGRFEQALSKLRPSAFQGVGS